MEMSMQEIISQMEKTVRQCNGMTDAGSLDVLKVASEILRNEVAGDDGKEIIKQILEKEKLSQQELADRMGTIRQSVNQALKRGGSGMRYTTFSRMIKALGYEIIVRKKYEK